MRNDRVVECWVQGVEAHGGHLYTGEGRYLWSYRQKIGFTTESGQKVVIDYTAATGEYISQTTSCHVNLAKQHADEVIHPAAFSLIESRGFVDTSLGTPFFVNIPAS
jgi:hypothetical protein